MVEGTDFKVGDTVRLRVDGSPGMVVKSIEADGRLLCAWNDGAGNPQSQAFPSRALRAIEPAATMPTSAVEPSGVEP